MSNGTKLVKYILIMVNFNVFVGITNYIKHTAIAIFLTLLPQKWERNKRKENGNCRMCSLWTVGGDVPAGQWRIESADCVCCSDWGAAVGAVSPSAEVSASCSTCCSAR